MASKKKLKLAHEFAKKEVNEHQAFMNGLTSEVPKIKTAKDINDILMSRYNSLTGALKSSMNIQSALTDEQEFQKFKEAITSNWPAHYPFDEEAEKRLQELFRASKDQAI